MILTVDIGNSNINFGVFNGDEICCVARIATDTAKTEYEYAGAIANAMSIYSVDKQSISGAIISSVVPPLNNVMKQAIKLLYDMDAILVGPGVKTGINIHCDNPASVGADIICACVAAHYLYGSPSLIVDMGTATKMMVMNDKGAFIGVSIIPGVIVSLDALAKRTAQLPMVSLEAPKNVIGKNTSDCMRSGIVFGNASMVDGMIDRIFDEVGSTLPVYATGGLASVITPHCKHNITYDEFLVLKGLNIIYKKNQ
ncbi:MAG: type III pantothenate kinase [Clostridia bacterium]|nr:type III pantothenate kinase [Clostridia bacterium]